MNYGKNYVLSLLRAESIEKRNAKRPSIKCESAQSNKSESEGDWVFTARDYGWSEAPTYTLNNPIELASTSVEELPFVDVMTPGVLDDVVGAQGEFVLYKADEAQYGFQASFGEELDTMIYAYCSADELKDELHQLQQYIKGIPADIDADVDKFLELTNNEANEEDLSMNDEPIDTQEAPIDEVPVNEASKEYTFVIPCEVTVTVTADSADLAREILMRSTEIEVDEDVVEFANGDARLRAVDFSGTNIDSLEATNEFDYE